MKVAVTYEDGNVFQHFGHTSQFKIYNVEDRMVTGTTIISTEGSGHGMLGGLLQNQGVDTLICGGIGGGAKDMLATAGIRLFGGVSGSADDAVAALLSGRLQYNPDIKCNHHGENEGHQCHSHGEHSCGHHS